MDLRCRHCGEPWDVFHLTDTPRAELLADGFQLGQSKHHVLACPCCRGEGERWPGGDYENMTGPEAYQTLRPMQYLSFKSKLVEMAADGQHTGPGNVQHLGDQ